MSHRFTKSHIELPKGLFQSATRNRRWLMKLGCTVLGLIVLFVVRGLQTGDETTYLESGRRLLSGSTVLNISGFPLTSVSLAASELLVSAWCTLPTCIPGLWGARLLIGVCWVLTAAFTTSYLREAGWHDAAHLMPLVFLVSPALIINLNANPSHWLAMTFFACVGMLMLRTILRTSQRWAVVLGMVIIMLWLSRADGLVAALLVFIGLFVLSPSQVRWKLSISYLGTLMVAMLLVSAWIWLEGGKPNWLNTRRTYQAFEQGYGFVYPERIQGSPFFEGRVFARQVFGSPEENRYSLLQAARRAPVAFLHRIVFAAVQGLKTSRGFGGMAVPGLLLTSVTILVDRFLRGEQFWSIHMNRNTRLALVIPFLLSLSLGAYMLTFYRMAYFLHFVWGLIGLQAVLLAELIRRWRSYIAAGRHRLGRRADLGNAFVRLGLVLTVISLIGTSVFALAKVSEWSNTGFTQIERKAVVKFVAGSTEPSAVVWASSPHLIRYANRLPTGFWGSSPANGTCEEFVRFIEQSGAGYVLLKEGEDLHLESAVEVARECREVGLSDLGSPFPHWHLYAVQLRGEK